MKKILVTGSSRGIGRAIAVKFAQGNKIYITGRDKQKLAETESLVEENGGETVVIACDLTKPADVVAFCDSLQSEKFDLIVNNAGIAIVDALADISIEDWQKTFDINVTAPFILIQKLSPNMPKGSSIVNIASIASHGGFANWSSYCMSKFALDGFTKSIRIELQEQKIRMINIYPAAVATDIWNFVPGEQDLSVMMKPEAIADLVHTSISQPESVVVEDITIRNMQNF